MTDIQNYDRHYEDGKLRLFLDISTYCNAGCPQCHRTNPDGLGKADWLPLIQWSLEEFKTAFPPETLSNVEQLEFCGTWGDPMMNKDIFKICEYIINESDSYILINTNGSIRNSDWWWDFGILGGQRINVVWALEGVNQEMHSHYRQNTDLQVILDNMEVFTQAGGRSEIFTVIFKHNEDHLFEIADMARERGCLSAFFVQSNRFDKKNTFEFTNQMGRQKYLEKASGEENNNFYWRGYNLSLDEDMELIKNESTRKK